MTTTDTTTDIVKVIEFFVTADYLSLTPAERLEAIGGAIRNWRQEQQMNESVEVSEA